MESRILLEDPYAYLDENGLYSAAPKTASSPDLHINIEGIRSSQFVEKRYSYEKIEKIAKSLHTVIWVNRKQLGDESNSEDPVALLSPAAVLRAMGYRFEVSDRLGQLMTKQGVVDCAGFIDRAEMYAGVSSQFPFPVRNFTAAHELGHAVLHGAAGMHRDRALDGGGISGLRDHAEVEADKFATCFLMPAKLIRAEFRKRFATGQFCITDDTAFSLISGSQDELRRQCGKRRMLARKLADADHYAGRFFESMSKRFRVSTEAMAIRLEELRLFLI